MNTKEFKEEVTKLHKSLIMLDTPNDLPSGDDDDLAYLMVKAESATYKILERINRLDGKTNK